MSTMAVKLMAATNGGFVVLEDAPAGLAPEIIFAGDLQGCMAAIHVALVGPLPVNASVILEELMRDASRKSPHPEGLVQNATSKSADSEPMVQNATRSYTFDGWPKGAAGGMGVQVAADGALEEELYDAEEDRRETGDAINEAIQEEVAPWTPDGWKHTAESIVNREVLTGMGALSLKSAINQTADGRAAALVLSRAQAAWLRDKIDEVDNKSWPVEQAPWTKEIWKALSVAGDRGVSVGISTRVRSSPGGDAYVDAWRPNQQGVFMGHDAIYDAAVWLGEWTQENEKGIGQ